MPVCAGLRTYVEKRICFSWNASTVYVGETRRLEEHDYSAKMNASVSSLRGLEPACRRGGVSVPGYSETAVRRSQSFAFPERREPLGDPSHAGDPDDSTVFCGESIWTGESGLAWQQVGFNVSRFVSRSVWVIL